MQYISAIAGFYHLAELNQLSTGQIALWHALMHINNRCLWQDWFMAPNLKLQLLTGLSRQGILKNRNALKQLGLIDFRAQPGNKATAYKMMDLSGYVSKSVHKSVHNGSQGVDTGVVDELSQEWQKSSTLIRHKTKTKTDIDLPAEDLCKNPGGFYAEVARIYNEICQSYPRLTKLSEARKKAIAARKNSGYTLADFRRLFELAEASGFLKGANNRNWQATFDWLLKDANMAKVLDGNYTDKGRPNVPKATGNKTLDDVFAEASRILQAEQGAKADDGN